MDKGDLDSWSQHGIVGKAFLTLGVKKSVHPCFLNNWKVSNNLRQISCFFELVDGELVDDVNTTTTKHHHFQTWF